jgi:hypothetical protein
MNRSEAFRIPITISAEEAAESDLTACLQCGKHDPKTKYLGWRKDDVLFRGLKENSASCEVCRMVVDCLETYGSVRCPQLCLPQRFALRCHPGVCFKLERLEDAQEEDIVIPRAGLEIYTAPDIQCTARPVDLPIFYTLSKVHN